MIVGIPKEVKDHEYRVGATPQLVHLLKKAGHHVLVETQAGAKIGFSDGMYREAGAEITSREKVYEAQMVLKVKEPQKSEFSLLKEGQILFCFLHLAPDPEQLKHLIQQKIVGIAFDTVTDSQGKLPLLTPMSQVAGKMAIQAGATALQLANGGKGLLLGGIPGVLPAKVAILGGGVVGTYAAVVALGCGADVIILDNNQLRLRELDDLYGPRLKTLYSTLVSIEESVCSADLVVGAVLVPGKKTPRLITRAMIQKMSAGSVFVDVAIDQGGCSETSRPTTHSDPTYILDGVVHYCVTNIPGACAKTATQGLTNALTPYVLRLANQGWKRALQEDPHLREGLNVCLGEVTNKAVAGDCGYPYSSPEKLIN